MRAGTMAMDGDGGGGRGRGCAWSGATLRSFRRGSGSARAMAGGRHRAARRRGATPCVLDEARRKRGRVDGVPTALQALGFAALQAKIFQAR